MSAMPKTDMLKTASRGGDNKTNKKSEREEKKVSSPNVTVSRQRTTPTSSSMSSSTAQKISRESGTTEWKRQSGRLQNPGFYPSASFWKRRKQEQMWEDIGFSNSTINKIGELRGLQPPTGLQKTLCSHLFGSNDVLVLCNTISDQLMGTLMWPILELVSENQNYVSLCAYNPTCIILVQDQTRVGDLYNLMQYLDRNKNVSMLGGFNGIPEKCRLVIGTAEKLLKKVNAQLLRLNNVHLLFIEQNGELSSETTSAIYELTGHKDMPRGERRRTKVVILSTTVTPKMKIMRELLLRKCFVLVETASESARFVNRERPLMATTSSNGKATDSNRKKKDSVRSFMDEPTENNDMQENNIEEWLSEINQKLENTMTGANESSDDNAEKVEGPLISF